MDPRIQFLRADAAGSGVRNSSGSPAPIRAMQSVPAPRVTTNPYNKLLDASLASSAEVQHQQFTWRGALLGRYDVFHWHWPEAALDGSTWWKVAAKHLLLGALIARHRMSRVAVVRTVHNLGLPDTNRVARLLLKAIDRGTTLRITLNEETRLPEGQSYELIPHGHYRDWFASFSREEPVPGRVGYFGNIRRYKSIDALLDAYEQACQTDQTVSLRVGGRPSSSELLDSVALRFSTLPRAEAKLEFLSDEELVSLASASQVVVLPYRFMHNSGSALAALSLDRPVLVPRNPTNEALAREVGEGWVLMYDGDLDAADLLDALAQTGDRDRNQVPDLSARDWDDAGSRYAAAYRRAWGLRRGRPQG